MMNAEAFRDVAAQRRGSLDDSVRCSSLHVLVTLPNDVVRWGLCSMLDALPCVRRTTGCSSVREALALQEERPAQVVIASAEAGELAQLGTRAHANGAKLLLLLGSARDEALMQASSPHADGFLMETDLTPQALQGDLARLLRGEMPMPAPLARELLAAVRRRDEAPRALSLTAREQQALALLVDGCSNKEIARHLGISEHGTKRHISNVLAKLNCPNRTLAVAIALRDGLVPPRP